jgi:hypothetical protein
MVLLIWQDDDIAIFQCRRLRSLADRSASWNWAAGSHSTRPCLLQILHWFMIVTSSAFLLGGTSKLLSVHSDFMRNQLGFQIKLGWKDMVARKIECSEHQVYENFIQIGARYVLVGIMKFLKQNFLQMVNIFIVLFHVNALGFRGIGKICVSRRNQL